MVLAAVKSPLKGRLFTLDADAMAWEWPIPPADTHADHKQEAAALVALALAWERRAGFLPLAAQVRQAAEVAGLEVASVADQYGNPAPDDAVY